MDSYRFFCLSSLLQVIAGRGLCGSAAVVLFIDFRQVP
ncbi:hypothetical protein JMJ77_0014596 [Colletotrichum scovillei]|uniref:Uncharacterized protein n=1 Tax=Colletotrichum scovillei TaxID=1209932 RepID=A0A9P7UB42_9PEZI|nr:hypothetical protein JMJ77_0014596 [Colletotrichum scovillei]KAG7066131.1 hypothetical protein JMJ78_0012868 [Colletotrichum scovillei]KAG7068732.1 hypothetical protein JMJ76_0008412 [Colletotrichum scovillei]